MSKDAAREQRLAEALRANLKRRKAQGRALAGHGSGQDEAALDSRDDESEHGSAGG